MVSPTLTVHGSCMACCKKPSVGTRYVISLILSANGLRKHASHLVGTPAYGSISLWNRSRMADSTQDQVSKSLLANEFYLPMNCLIIFQCDNLLCISVCFSTKQKFSNIKVLPQASIMESCVSFHISKIDINPKS